MIRIIRETEGAPVSWPAPPDGLSGGAEAIAPETVWSRIEQYITQRWEVRPVTWVIEGRGEWEPPLLPATLDAAERWDVSTAAWVPVSLEPSPLGLVVPSGTYRLAYDVGVSDDPPAMVLEAYRRLSEYWAEINPADIGATQISDGDYSVSRSSAAIPKGFYWSGAADLLRRYRRFRR